MEILTSLRNINCYDLNVFLRLFDAKVKPILLYGSELWGMNELYDIEKVHMFALVIKPFRDILVKFRMSVALSLCEFTCL